MTKKLIIRSLIHFIGLFFAKGLNLFLFVYLANLLLPHSFGTIIYYSTIILLITTLADFGIVQWYQKEILNIKNKKKLFNNLLNARSLTLGVSIVFATFYLLLSRRFDLSSSIVLVLILIPESVLSIFDGYYLQRKEPYPIALKQIVRSLTLLLTSVIFGEKTSLLVFSAAILLAASINFVWFVPITSLLNFSFCFRCGIKTLKKSLKYAVLTANTSLYTRSDSLIIENISGSTALGLYSAPYRYFEGVSIFPTTIAQNLFHISSDRKNIKLIELIKLMIVMITTGLLTCTALFLSSNFLTTVLIGNEYSESSNVLKILSLALFLFFINSPLSTVVQSSNNLKKFLPYGIFNTILNILLNILFIPIYGIIASAWIMIVNETLALTINLIFTYKRYNE